MAAEYMHNILPHPGWLVGWSLTSLFSTNMLYQRRMLHPSSVPVLPENALTCKKLDCLLIKEQLDST